MQAFTKVTAIAVPVEGENVDTDQILPARFLPKPRAGGFGQYLFHDLRFGRDGAELPDFVLNRDDFRQARILVGEKNFGCGSSRENAVWAVSDYGIRAVLAPSFGDIFFANCIKNGVLPVVLSQETITGLIETLLAEPGSRITVDLEGLVVDDGKGNSVPFDLDEFSRHCLLNGIDELDYTLSHLDAIDAFARARAIEEEWAVPALRTAVAPLKDTAH